MRKRGPAYWKWADYTLQSMQHSEILAGGTQIDVQSRLSRNLETQLFIGVYASDGRRLFEEFFPCRKEQGLGEALSWGVEQARSIATCSNLTWL